MNITEKMAYKWLIKQGYKKGEIVYQPRRSPDFLLSDGKRFEVKKLYGDVIWFTDSQLEIIRVAKANVLVFDPRRGSSPVAIIPADRVENDRVLGGIKITVARPRNSGVLRLSPQVKARLEAMKARNGHTTMDSVLRQVLAKAGESV